MEELVVSKIPSDDNTFSCKICNKYFNPENGWQIEEHKGTTVIYKFVCNECKEKIDEEFG